MMTYIVNLKDVNLSNIATVGGKNASTGEMIQNLLKAGIQVPEGFAVNVDAYRKFLSFNHLNEKIASELAAIKLNDIHALQRTSKKIRSLIITTPFPNDLEMEIGRAYAELNSTAVAVRSSATTEDLAVASFAGQQETYLNIKGLNNLLKAIRLVYASLFTSRAIAYRHDQHFNHADVALSVGIQPMIRSDKGASGVLFTLDTESGFDKVILISASYGLGEAIVQGSVNPDEFFVYKTVLANHSYPILQKKLGEKAIKIIYNASKDPKTTTKSVSVPLKDRLRFSITDADIQSLTAQALLIEKHYGKAMDIEWAKDGITGEIFIVQARPETVQSQLFKKHELERYILNNKGKVLVTGQSVGQKIASGPARVVMDPKKMDAVKPGDILVTDMTDPDWEPIMRRAAGIVTNRGGRTCHAAIIARELGIPAVIGCQDATSKIKSNQLITVSCAEGQVGSVYDGKLEFEVKKTSIQNLPDLPVKLCLNLGNPDMAFQAQFLPNDGVGLARIEFIISNIIGIHPNALLNFNTLAKSLKKEIQAKIAAYTNPTEFYIEKLSEGMAMIAAAFYPKPVIFRFSDFKTNEYANLLGGHLYEPLEENPMIGFRGASRYKDPR
ncbi:MAG TPA: phosphoenolpyruvate synthase, partial [Gammaproteobacteria bacterium]|nr:phosphoenolpyruvate synthase [Gammaproteobacteria bacterium]